MVYTEVDPNIRGDADPGAGPDAVLDRRRHELGGHDLDRRRLPRPDHARHRPRELRAGHRRPGRLRPPGQPLRPDLAAHAEQQRGHPGPEQVPRQRRRQRPGQGRARSTTRSSTPGPTGTAPRSTRPSSRFWPSTPPWPATPTRTTTTATRPRPTPTRAAVYVAWATSDETPPNTGNWNPNRVLLIASADGGAELHRPGGRQRQRQQLDRRRRRRRTASGATNPRIAISQGTADGRSPAGLVTVIYEDIAGLTTAAAGSWPTRSPSAAAC